MPAVCIVLVLLARGLAQFIAESRTATPDELGLLTGTGQWTVTVSATSYCAAVPPGGTVPKVIFALPGDLPVMVHTVTPPAPGRLSCPRVL